MKWTSFLLLLAFAAMPFAMPLAGNDDGNFASLRKEEAYDEILQEIEKAEQMANDPNSDISSLQIGIGGDLQGQRKFIKTFAPVLKGIVKVGKAILPPTARPTDAELESLAKDLSKAVRDVPVDELLVDTSNGDEKMVMTPENLNILVDLMSANVKHEGNKFMEQLKGKSLSLYCTGLRAKQLVYGDDDELPKQIKAECSEFDAAETEFIVKEVLEYLRSEELAVKGVKDLSVLINTLREPSSFDSLQSLYSALSSSDRWNSQAVLLKEVGKCMASEMDDDEKESMKQGISGALQFVKEIIAETGTEVAVMLAAGSLTELKAIASREFRIKLKNCIATGDALKSVALSSEVLLGKEKLDEIKARDEKAYAVLYLVNEHVKSIRARDGMSQKADAFVKKVSTVPNTVLILGKYFATNDEDMMRREKEVKYGLIDKFNALPAEVKKELVLRFPFRTLGAMTFFL